MLIAVVEPKIDDLLLVQQCQRDFTRSQMLSESGIIKLKRYSHAEYARPGGFALHVSRCEMCFNDVPLLASFLWLFDRLEPSVPCTRCPLQDFQHLTGTGNTDQIITTDLLGGERDVVNQEGFFGAFASPKHIRE